MSRWPYIFVVVGLLASAIAYDRVSSVVETESTEVASGAVISPSISDPPRLNSAWYCPIGSSDPSGFADHEVIVSNLSSTPAVANVTVLTEQGQGAARRVEVGPLSTERIKLSETQESAVAGAVVEVVGGEGVVGHRIDSAQGPAEGPCGTAVSNQWYFAGGRTESDSVQYLALMNPFPEEAEVSVEFRTVVKSRTPQELKGMSVGGRSIKIVEVGKFLTSEPNVATIIKTEVGRLVAERLQTIDGSQGAKGAALELGVANPSTSWVLPAGRITEQGDHFVTVFNPLPPELPELVIDEATGEETLVDNQSDETALVDILIWPNNPTDLDFYSVVNATREIRPGNFETIDLGLQASRAGFPLPYELGVNVFVDNDLPVVVERWQVGSQLQDKLAALAEAAAEESTDTDTDADQDPDAAAEVDGEDGASDEEPGSEDDVIEGDFASEAFDADGDPLPQPVATAGLSTTRGVEQLATRWVIPWVTVQGDSTTVAVASPEETSVEVKVLANGQFYGPFRATIPAAGRAVLSLDVPGIEGGAVEIVSDRPVAAEAMVVVGESLDVVPAIPSVSR